MLGNIVECFKDQLKPTAQVTYVALCVGE